MDKRLGKVRKCRIGQSYGSRGLYTLYLVCTQKVPHPWLTVNKVFVWPLPVLEWCDIGTNRKPLQVGKGMRVLKPNANGGHRKVLSENSIHSRRWWCSCLSHSCLRTECWGNVQTWCSIHLHPPKYCYPVHANLTHTVGITKASILVVDAGECPLDNVLSTWLNILQYAVVLYCIWH